MRLLELQLLRFGHFTERILNFDDPCATLHIIFGPNEAGKSTTLRAVSGMLFGIPETTRDHHVHGLRELRIGARLQNQAGECIHIVRRKGRKNTLLDSSERSIDEAVLKPFLHGMSRELFENLFGLSHEGLVKGGEDLLAGRGDLGEALFGAGIGMRNLHSVRTSLQTEADGLFTPSAQIRPLNLALKRFQEAKRQANQRMLRPREWKDCQQRLQQAQAELEAQEQDYQVAMANLQRLQRLQRVLPRLQAREQLLQDRHALGQVRLLPDTCAAERIEVQQRLRHGELQRHKYRAELVRCQNQQATLQLPEALLAHEHRLEALRDWLSVHRQAMADLPSLQTEITMVEKEADSLLRELGYDHDLDNVEPLRPDVRAQARIRTLAQQRTRLETELTRANTDSVSFAQTLEQLTAQLNALAPPWNSGGLQRLLAEIRRRGDMGAELRHQQQALIIAEEKAQKQLATLGLWHGTLTQVMELKVPPPETVERFQSAWEILDKECELTRQQRDELRQQHEDTAARIAALQAHGNVPDPAELQARRSERDRCWSQVRAVWLRGAQVADPSRLAADYERSLHVSDAVADRLWRDAERVAQHATLQAEETRQRDKLARFHQQLSILTQRQGALTEEWRELWRTAALQPAPPIDMLSWLRRYDKLVESVAQWRLQRQRCDSLCADIDIQRQRCRRALAALGQAPVETDESLEMLLQRMESLLAEAAAVEAKRAQLIQKQLDVSAALQRAQTTLQNIETILATWQAQWRQVLEPLGLTADTSGDEAEAVLNGLVRVFRKLDDARRHRVRSAHAERDACRFASEVETLTQACAPELAALEPIAAAQELINRLKKARAARQAYDNLGSRLKQLDDELVELTYEHQSAQDGLERLLQQAGVANVEELQQAEERSNAYQNLSAKLADLESHLLAEGLPLEQLLAQAQAVDPDRLPGEVTELETDTQALSERLAERREHIGQLKNQLEAMDGSGLAADAAVEAQAALAEIKTHVETYTRLKLSALLLEREIDRYRERNQGPLIRRGSEFFQRITSGAFAGLGTGFGDGDKVILLGIRSDGRQIPIEGLSTGTRDQLYLALRLASLEQHIREDKSLPLIVDDILINFDDHRARATLELLGKLAALTQVLFFTHHTRLLELAQQAVPRERLRIHELDRL